MNSLVHFAPQNTQPGSAKTVADLQPWAMKGDRYSPNLARWTKKNCKHWRPEVFKNAEGDLWIGYIDEERFFIGSRVARVLTFGGRAEIGCWTFPASDLTPIPSFWADYARIGRCAIDTDHSRGFIDGETRWAEDGDARSCNWCGNHRQVRRRWTETVKRQRWEATTANSIGTSNASEPKPPHGSTETKTKEPEG
jgi:hypothetical protein